MTQNSKIRYFIKRPGPKAKSMSYAIIAYVDSKPRQYLKLAPELKAKVDSINKLKPENTELLLREIIKEEYRKANVVTQTFKQVKLSEENLKILNQLWNDKYAAKSLVDEDSAWYDFERAIRRIEPLSLYVASAIDIKKRLKETCTNNNQQRRAISQLQEIFKYLKREVILSKPKADFKEIKFLKEAEVKELAEKAPTLEFKLCVYVLFGTGCRIGEALILGPNDIIKERLIHVGKQRTRKGVVKRPKWEKTGNVSVITSMWPHFKKWVALDRSEFDRWGFYKFVTSNSKISPHGLRHSHAIHLLSCGVSLEWVSNNLRNRIEICQKHYTGYAHTDASAEMLNKLI